jgi:L-ascorbate metabolism protein UlaG (beta-lactamase superfamily)
MRLTKFEHACFSLEKNGETLLIDPGTLTHDLVMPNGLVGIIITHEHPDHFDESVINDIISAYPDVVIYGPRSLVEGGTFPTMQESTIGSEHQIGTFSVEFFGGTHATIHQSIPTIDNTGILIDKKVYYPGDSFFAPNVPVEVLALPAAAPWLKIGESMDFLSAINPKIAFPTHDAIATDSGKQIADRLLGSVADKNGIDYRRIMTLDI